MELERLKDLLVHELQDIYSAESQALQGLQEMKEGASHPELKAAFQEHHTQSQNQIKRLEQVFRSLGTDHGDVTCAGMQGLVEEARKMLKEDADPDVKDAGLIAAAQKAEHYEIASYGTVATYAKQIGQEDVLNLLLQTLEEEKQTDEKLTTLAKQVINPAAVS